MAGLQPITRLTPISCGRCGRPLIHQDSIARGYGPECAHRIVAEQAGAEPISISSRVRAHGHSGTIVGYRPGEAKPYRVSSHGYATSFQADEVERIGGTA